jgi:uncharacterized membrane protein YqjE
MPQAPRTESEATAPDWNESVAASVETAWSEFRGLVHDQAHLAALEARQAGRSLVAIVAYGIVAAVLAVSAWLGLAGALVLVLITFGLAAWLAVLLGVLANLVGAVGFVLAIRRRSRDLAFPATLRSIGSGTNQTSFTERALGSP